jgi:hypothetical protein
MLMKRMGGDQYILAFSVDGSAAPRDQQTGEFAELP